MEYYYAYLSQGSQGCKETTTWKFDTEEQRDIFLSKVRWAKDPIGVMPYIQQVNYVICNLIFMPFMGLRIGAQWLEKKVAIPVLKIKENQVIVTKDKRMTHIPPFARFDDIDLSD